MSLEGKTILIGREDKTNNLLLSFEHNGSNKILKIKEEVPNCVSRCFPNEKKAHCKIDVLANDKIRVTNVNIMNTTLVNGNEIDSVVDNKNIKLELGQFKYQIDVNKILSAVENNIGGKIGGDGPAPEPVPIKHLEVVWNRFEKARDEIKEKQIKTGKLRMIPLITGSLSTLLALLMGGKELLIVRVITIIIAIVSAIILVGVFLQKDTSIEDTKNAEDELINDYVCPKCKHYLGQQKYKIVKQHGSCPYCRVKWLK